MLKARWTNSARLSSGCPMLTMNILGKRASHGKLSDTRGAFDKKRVGDAVICHKVSQLLFDSVVRRNIGKFHIESEFMRTTP